MYSRVEPRQSGSADGTDKTALPTAKPKPKLLNCEHPSRLHFLLIPEFASPSAKPISPQPSSSNTLTMDAWIRNIMKSMAFSSSSSNRRDEPEILLCKRNSSSTVVAASRHSVSPLVSVESSSSYQIQQQCSSKTRNRSSNSEHRIAHWDKKREKCGNCALIYLKTLSRHAGFCSVDCKSNARYLEKVNRTIRAMKDAVEQRQQHEKDEAEKAVASSTQEETAAPVQEEAQQQQPVCEDDREADEEEEEERECAPHAAPHTFSEFGLESRILDASNVEWAFSALY